MTETKTNHIKNSVEFDGRQDWNSFLAEVSTLIGQWQETANVYYYVTGCGLKSFNNSKKKLENYVRSKFSLSMAKVVSVLTDGCEPILALKLPLVDGANLEGQFRVLMKERSLRAHGCGCSLFVSDSQQINIKVLKRGYRIYGEGF